MRGLRFAAARLGVPPFVPTADDIGLLVQYSWPGNVRELAAVIERAAILGNGSGLDVARAIGLPVRGASKRASPPRLDLPSTAPDAPPSTLDQVAARHIERVLTQCAGRIEGPSGAAVLLGVNPHTLRSRMRKLGLDWGRFRPARPNA